MGLVRRATRRLGGGRAGKLEGEWELALFPESEPDKRRRLIRWDRFLLVGHGLIVVVSLYFGLWLVPVLVTLAPFYGGWLLFSVQQHPAHRLARRRAGLSALHPHGHLESVFPLPLLAHELPHRTPHVRRRAVLPARQATRGHQKRPAALSAGAIRSVDWKSPPSSNGKRPSQTTNTYRNCPRPSRLEAGASAFLLMQLGR